MGRMHVQRPWVMLHPNICQEWNRSQQRRRHKASCVAAALPHLLFFRLPRNPSLLVVVYLGGTDSSSSIRSPTPASAVVMDPVSHTLVVKQTEIKQVYLCGHHYAMSEAEPGLRRACETCDMRNSYTSFSKGAKRKPRAVRAQTSHSVSENAVTSSLLLLTRFSQTCSSFCRPQTFSLEHAQLPNRS